MSSMEQETKNYLTLCYEKFINQNNFGDLTKSVDAMLSSGPGEEQEQNIARFLLNIVVDHLIHPTHQLFVEKTKLKKRPSSLPPVDPKNIFVQCPCRYREHTKLVEVINGERYAVDMKSLDAATTTKLKAALKQCKNKNAATDVYRNLDLKIMSKKLFTEAFGMTYTQLLEYFGKMSHDDLSKKPEWMYERVLRTFRTNLVNAFEKARPNLKYEEFFKKGILAPERYVANPSREIFAEENSKVKPSKNSPKSNLDSSSSSSSSSTNVKSQWHAKPTKKEAKLPSPKIEPSTKLLTFTSPKSKVPSPKIEPSTKLLTFTSPKSKVPSPKAAFAPPKIKIPLIQVDTDDEQDVPVKVPIMPMLPSLRKSPSPKQSPLLLINRVTITPPLPHRSPKKKTPILSETEIASNLTIPNTSIEGSLTTPPDSEEQKVTQQQSSMVEQVAEYAKQWKESQDSLRALQQKCASQIKELQMKLRTLKTQKEEWENRAKDEQKLQRDKRTQDLFTQNLNLSQEPTEADDDFPDPEKMLKQAMGESHPEYDGTQFSQASTQVIVPATQTVIQLNDSTPQTAPSQTLLTKVPSPLPIIKAASQASLTKSASPLPIMKASSPKETTAKSSLVDSPKSEPVFKPSSSTSKLVSETSFKMPSPNPRSPKQTQKSGSPKKQNDVMKENSPIDYSIPKESTTKMVEAHELSYYDKPIAEDIATRVRAFYNIQDADLRFENIKHLFKYDIMARNVNLNRDKILKYHASKDYDPVELAQVILDPVVNVSPPSPTLAAKQKYPIICQSMNRSIYPRFSIRHLMTLENVGYSKIVMLSGRFYENETTFHKSAIKMSCFSSTDEGLKMEHDLIKAGIVQTCSQVMTYYGSWHCPSYFDAFKNATAKNPGLNNNNIKIVEAIEKMLKIHDSTKQSLIITSMAFIPMTVDRKLLETRVKLATTPTLETKTKWIQFCNDVLEQVVLGLICFREMGLVHGDFHTKNIGATEDTHGSFKIHIFDFGHSFKVSTAKNPAKFWRKNPTLCQPRNEYDEKTDWFTFITWFLELATKRLILRDKQVIEQVNPESLPFYKYLMINNQSWPRLDYASFIKKFPEQKNLFAVPCDKSQKFNPTMMTDVRTPEQFWIAYSSSPEYKKRLRSSSLQKKKETISLISDDENATQQD